jgi:type IV pilus assembly protein PilB
MSEPAAKGTIGSILSASQIITESDINQAVEEQKRCGCRFGEALLNLGIVTQEDIDWALSNQLDIPYIRLKKEIIDLEAVRLVPSIVARRHTLIPLISAGGELSIAIADPLNRTAVEEIQHLCGLQVNISVALANEIRAMIDLFYGDAGHDSLCFSSSAFTETVLDTINADLTGKSLLNYLLLLIIRNRLTSVSLYHDHDHVTISSKRSGTVRQVGRMSAAHYNTFSTLVRQSCSNDHLDPHSSGGMLSFSYHNRPYSFQAAFLPGPEGDLITIKQHISSHIPHRLKDLQLPPEQADAFNRLAQAKSGITFFASRNMEERCRFMDLFLEEADTKGKQVIILGDGPGRMRKRFPRITLPRPEVERSRTILDALDHEPDILVIEDATEAMPFSAACRAAMRGKLVLAGMEIRGTWNLLRHLLIYQQKNYFLPVFVNGVVSFKGIQLLCPDCRHDYNPPAEEIAAMGGNFLPDQFYSTSGCESCGHSGFSERRFMMDALQFDERFLEVFENSTDLAQLQEYLDSISYLGIKQQGLSLLYKGEVSPEEYIASVVL